MSSSSLSSPSSPPLPPPLPPSFACNGLPSNCDLPLTTVAFAAAHNSMASSDHGFVTPSHDLSLEKALEAGVRYLSLDVCDCDGELKLCHGGCTFLLGGDFELEVGDRDPEIVFENVRDFVAGNGGEVVILEFEINDDTLGRTYDVMRGIEGFLNSTYVHSAFEDEWPTLGELIRADKRLILFQHHADLSYCGSNAIADCPPPFHSYLRYFWQTPWHLREAPTLLNPDESCKYLTYGFSDDRPLILSNHFATEPSYGLPLRAIAEEVNTIEALRERHEACREPGRLGEEFEPNVIMVDFWSVGDVLEYVREENLKRAGVVETEGPTGGPTIGPTEIPTDSPTATPNAEPSEGPTPASPSDPLGGGDGAEDSHSGSAAALSMPIAVLLSLVGVAALFPPW